MIYNKEKTDYNCDECEMIFKSGPGLKTHKVRKHKIDFFQSASANYSISMELPGEIELEPSDKITEVVVGEHEDPEDETMEEKDEAVQYEPKNEPIKTIRVIECMKELNEGDNGLALLAQLSFPEQWYISEHGDEIVFSHERNKKVE